MAVTRAAEGTTDRDTWTFEHTSDHPRVMPRSEGRSGFEALAEGLLHLLEGHAGPVSEADRDSSVLLIGHLSIIDHEATIPTMTLLVGLNTW
jgi:hypothetical protein